MSGKTQGSGNRAARRDATIPPDAAETTFYRLLEALDRHPGRAAERYVLLARRLATFFETRGAYRPDECADRTLEIAGRRLAGGEQVDNISAYCEGIARLLLMESRRRRERDRAVLQELAAGRRHREPQEEHRDNFDRCLESLPERSRELILAYYGGVGGGRSADRRELADRLGIPLNALRIRAHRVRAKMETAIRTR